MIEQRGNLKNRGGEDLNKYRGVSNPPKSTHFKYPNGFELRGEVIEEVCAESSGKGGDYLFVIQKIEYEKSPSSARGPWIRFGYYRKEHDEGEYRWGSQTTFHADKETTERIIHKAVEKGILDL